MKVLSLAEPYATLIAVGKKCVETRSWQTSYRGELYIHASKTKMNLKDEKNFKLMELLDGNFLHPGYIICKCRLVDCVPMTEEYVKQMKEENEQEYLCGEYREGRYAWILEDIIPLKQPIKANGSLNIWNYYNENEIMNLMQDIKYGWIDSKKKQHVFRDNMVLQDYILQTPKEVMKNKVGICWDQVELERQYFKKNDWNIKTYFFIYQDDFQCVTHTFLTFEKDKMYYWFEHSWERFKGIHAYSSLEELIFDVKEKFIKYEVKENVINKNLKIYEYTKPKYHLSSQDFCKHCMSGKYISFDNQ